MNSSESNLGEVLRQDFSIKVILSQRSRGEHWPGNPPVHVKTFLLWEDRRLDSGSSSATTLMCRVFSSNVPMTVGVLLTPD